MVKLKKGKPKQGKHVSTNEPPNYNKSPVKFSLEKIQTGRYCFSELDQSNKACFADSIFKRKNITWDDINKSGRHKLGTEKIPKDQIKAPVPRFITDEIDSFLVFRYNGHAPMVGYREKDIFYVLWFDSNFTLYPH
ncbi:hypothetical protein MNBD_GAMMA08-929 [hydrothermal vent metagenome]|uniref:Uncharacterized protein n=1 Tax=hydrothermal vent metagenome TaxID=652676 RepID=A0A3B0XED2_9ZZZZ